VVDSGIHDFGERRQEEELAYTFVVTNQADAPITIVKTMSSCGCLVAGEDGRVPDTKIPPHDRMPIPVRFHTGTGQGATAGRIVVYYRLETEPAGSPPERFVALEVWAEVIPDYRITPREIDFGEIDGLSTQHVTRTVRITPEASKSIAIRQVRATSDFLTARLLPASRNDAGCAVEVRLDVSGFSESRFCNSSVVVSTDSKQLPEGVIQVRAKYLAPATIEPGMVVIGSNEEGEVTRELRVSSRRASRIRAVAARMEAIGVDFDDRQVSRDHAIRVRVALCSQHALEGELSVDLEFLPQVGGNVVRTLTIPIHRILRERERK
jgi:hypothetical protein